jgi:thiol:disulfide interchange protein DsbC
MGGQIIYTDDKLSFLIAEGSVIDPKTKRNLTAERMETLNAIDFSALPLENAIKVVKGNGKRQMAIFSDPDCIYCKKLEQKELAQISDVTMYTFLLPLTKLHPDAANKAKSIWCSADKAKAWTDWMLKGQLADKVGDCATPIDKNLALAEKFNVNGTPALFFANGRRLAGAYPAAEIEQALNKK